ncbi:MAG: hypothetical protein KGL39_24050 [Patescibacteria group bacterium]|nr:hypothetical protein [Patescibacteria group bacterium]
MHEKIFAMQIIKHDADSIARIAAAMFAIESGGAHGKGVEITIPPLTTAGVAYTVNFRPTVGLILYTAGRGFSADKLASDLRAAIDQLGIAHLKGFRATDVTPCATLLKDVAVVPTTIVRGRDDAKNDDSPPFARQFIVEPVNARALPSYKSTGAAFTWHIMSSIAAMVDAKCSSMRAFNAHHASVIYDFGDFLPAGPVSEIKATDVAIPAAPTEIVDALGNQHRWFTALNGIVVMDDGSITVTGSAEFTTIPRAQLPAEFKEWKELRTINSELDYPHCLTCEAPLSGDIVVIMRPKQPEPRMDLFAYNQRIPVGADLVGDRGAAMCQYCFCSMKNDTQREFAFTAVRSRFPRTQVEAFADCPAYAKFLPLITAGPAVRVERLNAFVVGGKFVLAEESVVPFQTAWLGIPALAALKLPIVVCNSLAVRKELVAAAGARPAGRG